MNRTHALLAALLLPLIACTAEEPAEPAERQAAAPAAETPAPPPDAAPETPAADEAPVEPVEESAALDEAETPDDVELALNEPAGGTSEDAVATARFEEGTHYRVLTPTQPTSSPPDEVEVAEVFWYGCPHCYSFEPFLASWQQAAPSWVNFVRIPAVWNDRLRMHARAYYTAEILDKLDELHTPLFRAMHVDNQPLATEDELAAIFAEHDVDEDSFRETFRSFAVETKVRRADTLNRRYGVSSVPVVVVNGKYVTDGEMAGGYETLIDIIDELAAAENE